jgi:NADH-quinone oxidoreductase subunit L
MYPLFQAAPHVLTVMALLGALSAVVGALVALAQTDIRRLLAWSTVSQMGLVFVAFGTGAYSAGLFQLMVHAFAKGAMVLAAATIVAAYRTTDIREISGAWGRMRTSSLALLAGAASSAGVVVLGGFWSISAVTAGVLRNTFPNHGHIDAVAKALVVAAVLLTVVLGAIYPLRMFFAMALGELPRRRGFQPQRVREAGGRTSAPVVLLGAMAAVGGLIGIPQVRVTFAHYVFAGTAPQGESYGFVALAITAGLALLGVAIAWLLHTGQMKAPRFGTAGDALADGLYVDRAYDWVVENALLRSAPLVARADRETAHRVVDELGNGVAAAAEAGRRWQVGRVDAVTLSAVAGTVIVAGAVVLGATGHLPWLGATR